ncbi:MAG: hypothetical protein ACLGH8_00920 [Bacteroidia bacterium]
MRLTSGYLFWLVHYRLAFNCPKPVYAASSGLSTFFVSLWG